MKSKKPGVFTALAARIRKRFGSRRAIAVLIVFAAFEIGGLVLAWTAFAGSGNGVRNSVCVGSYTSVACSTNWRYTDDYGTPPRLKVPDPKEEAAALERDRKWMARCRPVVRHDQLGVARYVYAAPGCEYGRSED